MWFPESLAAYPQFVVYIVKPSATRPGKTDKIPIDPQTGHATDPHNPANWLAADVAAALVASGVGHGIGFVFTENDPFFFLDIDGALDTAAGQWSQVATGLYNMLAGCFCEVSASGNGLHIIGTLGAAAALPHGTRNTPLGLEFYTSKRFVALTGSGATGDAGHAAPDAVSWVINNYFPPTAGGDVSAEWTTEPCAEWSGPADDEELILKMLASKQSAGAAFGNRASLQALWAADDEALAAAYPDQHRGYDASSADAALCQHLAFWTGKNCERIDRLFRASGLYRDKWEQRPDYRERTILKAVSLCKNVYTAGGQPTDNAAARTEPAQPTVTTGGIRGGSQLMTIQQQVEYFAGCVYIIEMNKMLTPDGCLLSAEQFKAAFGGYAFCLDAENGKDTRNAWEAFTLSQGYCFPKVHACCFRPELAPGTILTEEGKRLVNTYVPIETPRMQGDPAPFLDLLGRLLPDPNDRAILLAYLAALVQYPGVKFQWTPLIQGIEGNGKSLIIRCLEYAVGMRYTHLPAANDISNKFNAWILNKLFVAVEEIYVSDRQEAIDALKPLITNPRIDVQGKGDNQKTGDNRANFICTSNHQDAVRKTRTDRRYCVFFTAQQQDGDLERDGMAGGYFPGLYAWLRAEGYAIVNNYLREYKIPEELNPATTCHRAPVTSTTAEAIAASMGGVEQDIIEAVEQGLPGFAGGWVSSLAFDRLLKENKKHLTRNKRRDILYELGYQWHPALHRGRVNNAISDCGIMGKPVLYIKRGHISCNITTPTETVQAYEKAQQAATSGGMPPAADMLPGMGG